LADLPVDADDEFLGDDGRRRFSTIDKPLHLDMSACLHLEVSTSRLLGKVVVQRPIDIDRKSVMTLNEV
jgi:hypothetical protein